MGSKDIEKLTREEQMQIMEECTVDAEQMAHHDLPPLRIAIWAGHFFAYRTTEQTSFCLEDSDFINEAAQRTLKIPLISPDGEGVEQTIAQMKQSESEKL